MYHRSQFRTPDPLGYVVDRLTGRGRVGPAQAHRLGLGDHDHDHGDTESDILAQFAEQAEELHEDVVHEHGIFVTEFLGATGSGKTRLIERLIERAPADEHIGVIVGDVAGEDDARRFRDLGVEVANVNTGKECHLDPSLVEDGLAELDLDALDTLYIENVGNMVCPADFPLGAQARILVVSSTEGEDVVRKHPLLFQAGDATVINKTDVAEAVNTDVDVMASDVEEIAPDMPIFQTSAEHGDGIDDLVSFIDSRGHEHDHSHAHEHDHGDSHEHDHTHAHGDDTSHSHDHEHDHTHAHDENTSHDHEHSHDHDHDHTAPDHD